MTTEKDRETLLSTTMLIRLLGFLLTVAGITLSNPLHYSESGLFDDGHVLGHVCDSELDEISGVAASRRHDDVLYVHNDSGGRPRIFALSAKSWRILAIFNIEGATNCDWEDIAVGGGPGGDFFIYIGDIGGNALAACNRVYRVREPDTIEDGWLPVDALLEFTWNEANAETLLADPNGNVYLISKVVPGSTSRLYRLPREGWNAQEKMVLKQGSAVHVTLHTEGPTGGDISPDGQEVLLKTYNAVYYWRLGEEQTEERDDEQLWRQLSEAMRTTPTRLPYNSELQGEAICWDNQPSGYHGYYTLSEGINQPAYYYRRI